MTRRFCPVKKTSQFDEMKRYFDEMTLHFVKMKRDNDKIKRHIVIMKRYFETTKSISNSKNLKNALFLVKVPVAVVQQKTWNLCRARI